MRTHGQTRYPQSSPHLVKKDRATKKLLDKFLCNRKKSSLKTTYNQTVEAEVKVAVRAQRVRGGESGSKCRLLNGPPRAWGTADAKYSMP